MKRHFAANHSSRSRRFRPAVESLEARTLLANQFFVVPGAAGATSALRFDWTQREAYLDNEIGVYAVDDATGRVNGVNPGDDNYARAVMRSASREVLFDSSTGEGTHRTLSFAAGTRLAFYMIQGTTSGSFLLQNPRNTAGDGPMAFFSVSNANPDNFDHVRRVGAADGAFTLAWEDLFGGGDADFNDAVFSVRRVGAGAVHNNFERRALATPGTTNQTVPATFRLTRKASSFASELGLFMVDAADGRIGDLSPGEKGYAEAALERSRRRVLFTGGHAEGASRTLDLQGGSLFGLYLVPNGTAEGVLTQNPDNRGPGPVALFSFVGANPDGYDHFRQLGDATFAVEDTPGGGDGDFDDLVVQLNFGAPQGSPTPPGPVDTTPPTLTARLANDTGVSNTDGITNDPTITGTLADAGGIGRFRAGFGNTPPANFVSILDTLQPNGTFTLNLARLQAINGGTLPDATYTLHLIAEDNSGNPTQVVDVTFTLDRVAPASLTFNLAAASDNLPPAGDRRTSLATVRLEGTTEATARIQILGTNLTTTAAANGSFAFDNVGLASGLNDFTMRVTDAAGNTRDVTDSVIREVAPVLTTALPDLTLNNTDPNAVLNLRNNFDDVNGTVVRISTSLGNIDLDLFDNRTPITVQNFLKYALGTTTNGGSYNNTIIHRVPTDFVVQGGGFTATPNATPGHIPTDAPIVNEPGISNTRGTIAMAKTSDPNSATSEWFINLNNNTSLDNPANSGGFTVFGQVRNGGLAVADAIDALPKVLIPPFTADSPNPSFPVRGFTPPNLPTSFTQIGLENYVVVNGVSVRLAGDTLTYQVSSSNEAVVQVSFDNATRQLTVNPVNGATGTATVTVTVTDNFGMSVQDSFVVNVT